MIFVAWLCVLQFAKMFLLDLEDQFFKYDTYGNWDDCYDAAYNWTIATGHEWDWDIGTAYKTSCEIIQKVHTAINDCFLKEWAQEGFFDIVIPGININVPIITNFILTPLPVYITDPDTKFYIYPWKMYQWDKITMTGEKGYVAMRRRTTPLFEVDGSENFVYTIDGVTQHGYEWTPAHKINDRDISAGADKAFIYLYWFDLLKLILKSETLTRWIQIMLSTDEKFRHWYQNRIINGKLDIHTASLEEVLKNVRGIYKGCYR